MATVKAVHSRASIGKAVNYVTKDEKTEDKLITGKDCDPFHAIEDMKHTKELWGKTGGRQYDHYVQSFHKDENITPEKAHEIAQKWAEREFKGHEVLIATHTDRGHIHSHFIVNTVNFENGKKLHTSAKWLDEAKSHSDELCREYGLTITEKGKTFEGQPREDMTAWNKDKYNLLEKAEQGKVKSYVLDTAMAVMDSKEQATSRAEFIQRMAEKGYKTTWEDSKKHITFENAEGQKVRASNLEKTFKIPFGKEQLEHEFENNARTTAEPELSAEDREQQLGRAIEQIREINERAKRDYSQERTRVEVGEIEGETTDGIFKKSEETSGRGSRIEAGASDLLQTNQRMGGDEQTMESAGRTVEQAGRTVEQAGRTVEQAGKNFIAMQRRIGEQQDMLERELAEQQQFYGTIIRGIEEIARDFKEIEGKQRELGRKQSNIIDRIGEIGDRVRDFTDKLKNNIQQVFKRGGR